MNKLINQLMIEKAVCRTALATPGLLKSKDVSPLAKIPS